MENFDKDSVVAEGAPDEFDFFDDARWQDMVKVSDKEKKDTGKFPFGKAEEEVKDRTQ